MGKRKPCNYCIYQKARERAEHETKCCTVLKNGLRGGYDIFIHPPSVDIVGYRKNEAVLGEHHLVWLEGELDRRCMCDA